MKMYEGVELYHHISWLRQQMKVKGQPHAQVALPKGKISRYPLNGRLGGPQSQPGRCGEEQIFFPAGNRTPAVESAAYHFID